MKFNELSQLIGDTHHLLLTVASKSVNLFNKWAINSWIINQVNSSVFMKQQ
jgi:hypothetical protein